MAVLASKIVPGKPFTRVRYSPTDLICGIGEQSMPIFDKFSERIVPDLSNVGGPPLHQIDHNRLCCRDLIGKYQATQRKRSNLAQDKVHGTNLTRAIEAGINLKTCERRVRNGQARIAADNFRVTS